jgi:(2Fe-2S) ferredoxin
MSFYASHIFCCTNRREPGNSRGSCGEKGSEELRAYMKSRVKEMGLQGVRVNSAGCLDRCELGPCIVIYPQGTWYRCNTREAVDSVLESIKSGMVAEGLEI